MGDVRYLHLGLIVLFICGRKLRKYPVNWDDVYLGFSESDTETQLSCNL